MTKAFHSAKPVLRDCVACRKTFDREDLTRVTRDFQTGQWMINKDNKVFGRSSYLCKNETCKEKLLRTKKSKELIKVLKQEN